MSDVNLTANINRGIIYNSNSEKLLGVTIYYKQTFDEHVSRICDKASQKLSPLPRIRPFMKPVKKENNESIH